MSKSAIARKTSQSGRRSSTWEKAVGSCTLGFSLLESSRHNLFAAAMPIVATKDLACNVYEDTCPTQFNGVCEAGTGSCNLDCLDCDQCEQFSQDCTSCLQNGCYYCAGDATCYNSNLYSFNQFSHCTDATSYLHSGDSCEVPGAFFSDPEYAGQSWVYEMINVVPVWQQGITGTGIRVRINDNGVDSSHPELTGRFDTANSCPKYLPQTDGSTDLASLDGSVEHGTSVAGILGSEANNNECSVGIAPTVTLSACNIFADTDYLPHAIDSFDISQNSFGTDGCKELTVRQRNLQPGNCPFKFVPDPEKTTAVSPCAVCPTFSPPSEECSNSIRSHCKAYYREDELGCLDFLTVILGGNCLYEALTEYERDALTTGITQGRQGKGIVYVFASGNAFNKGDTTNFQSYTNSRLVISVGAVAKDRTHASYSTPGASIFITGPGGDSDSLSNHITIGIGGRCKNAGIGTSFACPVVSGVVALVLEANPNLTWRDVQYVLAQTSQRVDDPQDTTAYLNAAGYWHSNWYGFGIVNAEAAVALARNWKLVGQEQMILAETGLLNRPIVDDQSSFLETSVTVEAPASFSLESVELQLDIDSIARGQLEIILTSPQGTRSIVSPGRRPENSQVSDRWKLMTVRNWGENPNGVWKLTIVDLVKGGVADVDGTAACVSQPWETYVFGNELIDCNTLEAKGLCADGQLDPTGFLAADVFAALFTLEVDGVLAEQACCACGGGETPDIVSDQLKQWTLVMYGTGEPVTPPGVPTPTGTTSKAPTGTGTGSRPSARPAPSPTKAPISIPTNSPATSPDKSEPTATAEKPTTGLGNGGAGVNITDAPSIAPIFSFGGQVPTPPPSKAVSSDALAAPGDATKEESKAPVFSFGAQPPSPPPSKNSSSQTVAPSAMATAPEGEEDETDIPPLLPLDSTNSSSTFSPSPSMNSSSTFSPSPSMNSSSTFSPSPSMNSSSTISPSPSMNFTSTSSPSPSSNSSSTFSPSPSSNGTLSPSPSVSLRPSIKVSQPPTKSEKPALSTSTLEGAASGGRPAAILRLPIFLGAIATVVMMLRM